MRHLDIVPDWAILVLAVLVVAGVFKLFGGFGVLVLGIAATAVWIAQCHGVHSPPASEVPRGPAMVDFDTACSVLHRFFVSPSSAERLAFLGGVVAVVWRVVALALLADRHTPPVGGTPSMIV